MIDSYDKLTIKKYKEILDLANQTFENEIDLNMELVRILTDQDPYSLDINEVSELLKATSFLSKEYKPKKIKDIYIINNQEYTVSLKMTAGQFIDFQTFGKDKIKYMANIAACILIPKDKKYGEGYDPLEKAEEFSNYLYISDYYDISFFFLKLYQKLLLNTLRSLEKKIKKQPKTYKTLKSLIQTRQLIHLVKNETEPSGLIKFLNVQG